MDNKDKENEIIKMSSVNLFKKIYNIVCGQEIQSQIGNENCKKYDLNKCINDNINDDNNSRFLLLGIKPSLSSLIYNIIEVQNPEKTIDIYDGSPFIEDNSNEYKFKKVNEIKDDSKNEKLIILQNLNQIQSLLYNLYSMNYTKKNEQKFSEIYLDSFSKIKIPVNNLFRIILLIDRENMNKIDITLLDRLEKMEVTFDKLLNDELLGKAKKIIEEINLEYHLDNLNKIEVKYNLKDLLINCGKEEIEGFIYDLDITKKSKKI